MNGRTGTDVLVAGGGTAGIAAALAAAKEGREVLIIEQSSFIGGLYAVGLAFARTEGENSGLFKEIKDRACALGGGGEGLVFDPETLKHVASRMLDAAGVTVLYNSFIYDVVKTGDRVTGVKLANKGGTSQIKAKVVIDATGDGDVCALAGVPFWKGRETDGRLQGINWTFQIGGIEEERLPDDLETALREATAKARKLGKLHIADYCHVMPIGGRGVRRTERYVNICDMMTNIDGTDPWELSRATTECHKQIWECVNFYREYVPGMEKCHLIQAFPVIGIRETRRIQGEYTLTEKDVLAGRKFEDAIARASFFIDLHDPEMFAAAVPWWKTRIPPPGDWYTIPWRSLLPKGIDNVLMAGRCISSDREANGSLRIIPTCMATGQAAGTGAAIAAREDKSPKEIDYRLLRERLLANGCVL